MGQKRILINIIANWANFFIMIGMAFVVSPIIVHSLGNENYGIWTLVVSVTGYFTVLDFGVNTAIVRYISKYTAEHDFNNVRSVYSTSFLLFIVIGGLLAVSAVVFASFFGRLFHVTSYSTSYIYFVFLLVALDMALGLIFSVQQGTMQALQEFFAINVIATSVGILQNVIIVLFLLQGFSILTLAVIQICMSFLKYFFQHIMIRKKYNFIFFDYSYCNKNMLKKICNYSVYSFLIAIALKVLFYTDSIVIGSMITVADVTFYAIPSTLVDYLQKLVWSIVAVLIPVISAKDALGLSESNKKLYLSGTKANFFFSLPIIIVLFAAGSDFIRLWMGDEYGDPSGKVLQILLIGYIFGISQLVAHGILKGIGKHRILAYILCFEAILNLLISLLLAKPFGIYGVAIGTAIPLIICNLVFIPWYTCRNLNIGLFDYLWKSYYLGVVIFILMITCYKLLDFSINSYFQLLFFSTVVAAIVWSIGFFYIVDLEQRKLIFKQLGNRISR